MMGPAVAALPTASTTVTEQPVKPAVPALCMLVVLAAACASPDANSGPVAVETVTEVVTETVADAAEVSATAEPTALPSCEGALPSQECVEPDPIDDAEPESDPTDPGSDCEGVPDELCDADFSDVVSVEPATCGPAEYATIDALAAESQRLQAALFDIPAPYSGGVTGPSTGQDYTDYGNQQQATMDLRMDLNAAKSDVDQQLAALRQDCANSDPDDVGIGGHGVVRSQFKELLPSTWTEAEWDQYRRESGGNLSDAEWEDYRRRQLPPPGDDNGDPLHDVQPEDEAGGEPMHAPYPCDPVHHPDVCAAEEAYDHQCPDGTWKPDPSGCPDSATAEDYAGDPMYCEGIPDDDDWAECMGESSSDTSSDTDGRMPFDEWATEVQEGCVAAPDPDLCAAGYAYD